MREDDQEKLKGLWGQLVGRLSLENARMPNVPFEMPGRIIRKMNCTPFTELLQSERAEVPDTIAAILELVDNPIEEYLRDPSKFSKQNQLDIEVFAHEPKLPYRAPFWRGYPEMEPAIVVQDNAGGIAADDFERMFRFGERGELAKNGISAYGRGGKRARLKLGNRHLVISRHGEKQCGGYVVVKTGADTNWDLNLKETIDPKMLIPKGTTRIGVTDLLFTITIDWLTELRKRLPITYSEILDSGKVKISLNELAVEQESIEASIPWSGGTDIEPSRIAFSYRVPVVDQVKKVGEPKTNLVEVSGVVTIGLTRKTTTTLEWGFDIICNGRLLQRYVKSEIGFCEEAKGGWDILPSQKISMIRGVVHLHGPSKAMPWRANKVEFDDEKVAPLREAIVECCDYWVDAGWKIKGLGTDKIGGTLDHPFTKNILKIRIITRPPKAGYNPPTKVNPLDLRRIAFKTTTRIVDMAKKVFEIDDDEVSQKAKELFEDAVQTDTSMYKGKHAAEPIALKDLLRFGVAPPLLTKLGKAGIEIEQLRAICKKDEAAAISELQRTLDELSAKESKRIYHAVQRVKMT